MYKHPLSAHNEAAGSLVKGSGYESSDPVKDCVRESKTAADPLQAQACVNGLDLRHDRSDLVPPPGSWGFPSWRHGEAKKKVTTLQTISLFDRHSLVNFVFGPTGCHFVATSRTCVGSATVLTDRA